MRTCLRILVPVLAAACTMGLSVEKEGQALVRETDLLSNADVKIISVDEYTAKAKRFKLERVYFNRAHTAAAKKWEAAGLPGRYPRCVSPRSITKLMASSDSARLERRLEEMKARGASARENKGKKKTTNKKNKNEPGEKARQEAEKRKEEKEKERQALEARAHNLFITELNAIVKEVDADVGQDVAAVEEPALPKQPKKEGRKVTRMGDGIEKATGPKKASGPDSILNKDVGIR